MAEMTDFACEVIEDDLLDVVYRPTGKSYKFKHVPNSTVVTLQSTDGPLGGEPPWLVDWMARSVAQAFVRPKRQRVAEGA